MQILVKTWEGEVSAFNVFSSDINDIISHVKAKLHKTEGIPPEEQRLILIEKNQFLDRFTALPSYYIHGESTLYMLMCMDTQFFVRFMPDERFTLRLHNIIQQDKIQYYKEIFGKFATGKIITLELGSCDILNDVKDQIEDMERIPCGLQKLVFCGKHLHNGYRKLVDYSIKGGSILELSLSIIFVKELSGQLFLLQVESSDTLQSVKAKISSQAGIHPRLIQLTYPKHLSDDDRSLEEYNIQHLSTIYFSASFAGVTKRKANSLIYIEDSCSI